MITFINIEEFAGGGGATTGRRIATGRSVDVAVNHSPTAIAMHAMNHPETLHFCQDVWQIDPLELLALVAKLRGLPAAMRVAIASGWFSPDCKHFSKAKGGALVDRRIRGLAYIVLKWCGRGSRQTPCGGGARRRGPACPLVIYMENVEEFKTWGPLVAKRCPQTGRVVKCEVRDASGVVVVEEGTVAAPGEVVPYRHQWLVPDPRRAGLYFKRFVRWLREFGGEIDYRELRASDYGTGTSRLRLYLVARFDGAAVAWPEPTHGDPASAAVAAGLRKPYISALQSIDWQLPCPSIFLTRAQARRAGVKRPLVPASCRRIAKGFERYVMNSAEPVFVTEHANASGRRNFPGSAPLRTICAEVKGGHFAVVAPFVAKHCTGAEGADIARPMPTITGAGWRKRPGGNPPLGLVAAFLAQHNTGVVGHGATEPFSTILSHGSNQALVMAYLVKYYGNDGDPKLTDALHTITTKDRFALVEALAALPELTPALEKKALRLARFLRRHGVDVPGRFATVAGLVVYDLGTRMFSPRELFRAQGFPEDYVIDRGLKEVDGATRVVPLTKAEQVQMVGNSVCPPVAAALIAANPPRLPQVQAVA